MYNIRSILSAVKIRTGECTAHKRPIHHLSSRCRLDQSELCPRHTGSMATEHLLQACPPLDSLGRQFWPAETLVARKPSSSLDDL